MNFRNRFGFVVSIVCFLLPHYLNSVFFITLVHWQVFGLKREVEIQRTRRLEMEAEIAERKVAELSSNHENVRDMVSLGFE